MSFVSSRNSRLIHDKRVPNLVRSQYHLMFSLFFIFSSQWASLEAHNLRSIAKFLKTVLKPSNLAHQQLYFKIKNDIKFLAGEAL